MMEKMYDLAWEIDGDTITLEQDGGCEGAIRIDLHISQLRLLAERTGLQPVASAPQQHAASAEDGDAMHSLQVETDSDGMIWVEQTRLSGMGGTDAAIELHPSQAAWLAAKLLKTIGQGETHEAEVAALRRRMLTLHRKLIEMTGHFAWEDLFKRSSDAEDLFKDVSLAAELANEFVADLLETGNGKGESASARYENSQGIHDVGDK